MNQQKTLQDHETMIRTMADEIKVIKNKILGIENFLKKQYGEEL